MTKTSKPRNYRATDTTLRNTQAANKKIAALWTAVKALRAELADLKLHVKQVGWRASR